MLLLNSTESNDSSNAKAGRMLVTDTGSSLSHSADALLCGVFF